MNKAISSVVVSAGVYLPHLKQARITVALVLLALSLSLNMVSAAAGDVETALEPVSEFICGVAAASRTILAFGIIASALIIGGLMRAAGNRAGIGVMVGAVIGGLLVLIAPTLATAIVGEGECQGLDAAGG